MSFFKNTASLLAIMCVIPAAQAATARPSVLGATTGVSATGNVRRMPTMTAIITNPTAVSSGTTGSTLLSNAECIDAYSACIKGADACGSNFEECTNKVLFHAQMPDCLSTLAQCDASGIKDLFGTATVSALASGATTNSYGEVTDYMYPLDGSVLGQMINAASIANKYDTQTCVKRYSTCLRKDSVCGEDFELCTTTNEFKKQAVFCASTLARCQSAGLTELFGSASANAVPTATSRIGMMIEEGASLAAVNAVSTCYKVADQCMLNACSENPYMCYENATQWEQDVARGVIDGTSVKSDGMVDTTTVNKSSVRKHIRGYCAETIGTNKYCFATFLTNGLMPTSSQLLNEDNQDEVFDMAYDARMNSAMRSKIQDMVNDFDERAKSKCVDTFKKCAMRSCGDGSGAACYSLAFGHESKSINNENAYNDIKNGCAAIINTDANCVYAAQHADAAGLYSYQYSKGDAFTKLFPEYKDGSESDPLSIVAELNAALSSSFNEAAVAEMRKQCQSVATGCVKSMCGTDYENCYRRRSDIFSSLTNTNDKEFNKSMNKVNGVLDYTIILGMCVDTVKNSDACTEHMAIEAAKLKISNEMDKSVWGGSSSARGAWIDAGAGIHMESVTEETDVQQTDDQGNKLCTDNCGSVGVCGSMSTKECGAHDTPAMISYTSYIQSQAANSLFKDLIYDLEIEAQAAYNAKLTYQMNQCMAANASGGIMGSRDAGSTYAWVKLKNRKIPDDYSVNGIPAGQMVGSNDLYNSFCRVRVTLQSSDRDMQKVIQEGNWSTAYFAIGDGFTCGSWIPAGKLEELATAAAKEETADMAKRQKTTLWVTTVLGGIASTTGGGFLGQKLATDGLDGWNANRQNRLSQQATGDASVVKGFNRWNDHEAGTVRNILQNRATNIGTCNTGILKALIDIGLKQEGNITMADEAGSDCKYVQTNCTNSSLTCGEGEGKSTKANVKAAAKNCAVAIAPTCTASSNVANRSANGWTKGGAATLGAIGVGALGTGAIYHITKEIQEKNLSAAEQLAYDEFMETVGSKIKCVIGPEEVASYGTYVETTADE